MHALKLTSRSKAWYNQRWSDQHHQTLLVLNWHCKYLKCRENLTSPWEHSVTWHPISPTPDYPGEGARHIHGILHASDVTAEHSFSCAPLGAWKGKPQTHHQLGRGQSDSPPSGSHTFMSIDNVSLLITYLVCLCVVCKMTKGWFSWLDISLVTASSLTICLYLCRDALSQNESSFVALTFFDDAP